jgi:hypothetical protein
LADHAAADLTPANRASVDPVRTAGHGAADLASSADPIPSADRPPAGRPPAGRSLARRALAGLAPRADRTLLDASRISESDDSVQFDSNEPILRTFDIRFILSSVTGEGVDRLLAALADFAARTLGGAEPALVSRQRQRAALDEARAALARAAAGPLADDLLAEDLRLAARALSRLTGRVDVEDILDVIFRDFCIGK